MTNARLRAASWIAALCLSTALVACDKTIVGPPETPGSTSPISHLELEVGTGATLGVGQTATIDYAVTLTNGHPVDAGHFGGAPMQFVTGEGQVISGIDQGVRGMRVGGRRLLSIPPEYAFGTSGIYDAVPPNSILLVDVRLLGVAEWPGPGMHARFERGRSGRTAAGATPVRRQE